MARITTPKGQDGFTLIETTIALVLMMIVSVGLAPLFVYATRYNSTAAIRAGALAIAQIKLEQLRSTPFDSCVSSTETLSVGDPTTGSQTYTVQLIVVSPTSTLKDITLVVTPQARSTTERRGVGASSAPGRGVWLSQREASTPGNQDGCTDR